MAGEASTPENSFWGFNSADISPETGEEQRLEEEKVGLENPEGGLDSPESSVSKGVPSGARSEEKSDMVSSQEPQDMEAMESTSVAEDEGNSSRGNRQEAQEEVGDLEFSFDHFGPGRAVVEPDASESILEQVNPVSRALNIPVTSTANREGPSGDDRISLRRSRRNRGIPRERLDL